eukprot:TRINITY_DN2712_c0_g2_i1.p1 TRINITY_DN2712_c0_g2~~TRINITY_DN2712_c0_g2_i1.p1  ORF type:complete len:226 (-),score=32.18 TRINITY_DN2712_c0_g2_i1:594-1271(-)
MDIANIKKDLEMTTESYLKITQIIEGHLHQLDAQLSRWSLIEAKIKEAHLHAHHQVHFNVGGTRFSTTKSTLLAHKDTYFHVLASSDAWKPDQDGTYFIDRSPKYFEYVLDYLRSGVLDLEDLPARDKKRIQMEFDYFQVPFPCDSPPPSYLLKLTPLGAKGRQGPTSLEAYQGTGFEKEVSLAKGIQIWRVPYSGQYQFVVAGAKGGDNGVKTRGGWGLSLPRW